jgi:HAE1 family hydrophobic/amphiphilic exporter-1
VTNNMPDGADDPRIVKADANSDPVMRLAVTSDRYNVQDMTILVEDLVVDRLAAVPGVADVNVYGDREKIFRVDVDQSRLAAFGLTLADLRSALSNVALDVPAGSLTAQTLRTSSSAPPPTSPPRKISRTSTSTTASGSATSPGDARRRSGRFGPARQWPHRARHGHHPPVCLQHAGNFARRARGNGRIQEILPEGVDIRVTSDDATFIRGAIEEVRTTLILAVLIVIAIIFLFLRDWRATIIPAVTLPVALIGAFAAIWLAGFSVNILTLLALVLATGMVVDDAIVVLENIVRKRNEGMGARRGRDRHPRGVLRRHHHHGDACRGLHPDLVPAGAGGRAVREFGFVLAFTVMISSVVALTLCPMLASRLIKRRDMCTANSLCRFVAFGLHVGDLFPASCTRRWMRRWSSSSSPSWRRGRLCPARTIPQELTPPEDRAVALMRISAPQGVSLDYTREKMTEIERLVAPLRDSGEVQNVFAIAGTGGSSNNGFMVLTLAPWGERAGPGRDRRRINRASSPCRACAPLPSSPTAWAFAAPATACNSPSSATATTNWPKSAQQMVEKLEQDPRFRQIGFPTRPPSRRSPCDRPRARLRSRRQH